MNLAAAKGHPASVMKMSFATQALAAEYCLKNKGKLAAKVHDMPRKVEDFVAATKLARMGIAIKEMTEDQKKYTTSWQHRT